MQQKKNIEFSDIFYTIRNINISSLFTLKNHHLLARTLDFLIIIASIILVISISLETLRPDYFVENSLFFEIQFWICIFFTISFFILLYLSPYRLRFLCRYSILLLLSIPYLVLFDHSSIELSAEQTYLISFIPLIRGSVALVILTLLLVERHSTALFISYILILLPFIYLISLIFFIFENPINPHVLSYADALWWAAMTVTTNGSNIIPITTIGKVSTTILAATGMTTFPIFTVYFTTIVNRLMRTEKHNHKNKSDH